MLAKDQDKWSEHGLGHLLNPMNPDDEDRDWIRAFWEGILTEEVRGQPYSWPAWLDRPAVGRITVSWPVIVAHITYIGKESNKLDDREAGLVHDLGEVITEYADPRRDAFRTLALPVLRTIPPGDIVRELSIAPSTLRDIRAGRTYPHPKLRARLVAVATRIARKSLRLRGVSRPHSDLAAYAAYLTELWRQSKRACLSCGGSLTHPHALYCSSACKQRAHRQRMSRSKTRPV